MIPFHYVYTSTLVSGSNAQFLAPTLFPRVGTESDAWAHFRVRNLAFRLHRNNTLNGPQMAGFVGGVQDSPPSSVAQLSEVLPSCFMSNVYVKPTEWVRVPKADLAGPFPWYKTIAGSADPTEESPGYFVVVGTGTDTFYVEFRGTFEFKVSLATANTPAALEARRKIREERRLRAIAQEKDVLLKILSTSLPTEGVKP